ncbi:alpha-1,2-mannosyltransferase alg11 [Saitoella complicata NRRL Y-17804]|uniref:alpha-1,2-mannosyltransferase alg11 n=1 Tax=Saitoella complicata (strain BCRC 22490 / CBS 7301 / JCM 7358 / NBRC 10748 / NRRL Y-17804) TaxID=698492 RepID=UPI00086787A4|nr:alpha-1,2-mannosyltransferase alg11 [Saitoella complicata NRRL Y-17804]ODQ53583.1 alpha-1,2-mannosyltransferase alg11 [Saitoella complicata NRRL Y-17804]
MPREFRAPQPRAGKASSNLELYFSVFLFCSISSILLGYLALQGVKSVLGSRLRRRSVAVRNALKKRVTGRTKERPVVIGFFHPYCNAGGGGERVLWTAIRATQQEYPHVICAVYSGDIDAAAETILSKVQQRFGINLDTNRVEIVFLKKRHLVSAKRWPRFTLAGQSAGSIPLVYEAISALVPDIFIDTMGYAFTLPAVSFLLDIPVAAYVHYPTISTDMLEKVPSQRWAKLVYWRAFAKVYSWVGSAGDVVMTNSSWTRGHILSLWGKGRDPAVVYPPCDTKALRELDITKERERSILCLAQFRPEKDHALLLKAFAKLLKDVDPAMATGPEKVNLVLIGSVRGAEDAQRVESLKKLAQKLGVDVNVEFVCDAPWPEVIRRLGKAWVGANAMWNEHFGIGVVEYMAAGLIPVVHDSAGPKMDIVVPLDGQPTGFHATDEGSFAQAFHQALTLPKPEVNAMRARARAQSDKFSEKVFDDAWLDRTARLLELESKMRAARRT